MFETTVHLGYSADDGDVGLVRQLLDFVEPGARVERKRRIGRVGVNIAEASRSRLILEPPLLPSADNWFGD